MEVSDRLVERVSAYRRLLRKVMADGTVRIYSHELASLEGVSSAQVRRDLMTIGYAGSPAKGYDVAGLIDKIGELLDPPDGEGMVLVGVGHLGKAILSYATGRFSHLSIVATFDNDSEKVGRVTHGCRCFAIGELGEVLRVTPAAIGIITVPAAVAQEVADQLVAAGVRGLVNFAPVRLRTPREVFVEDVDITGLLEKVAFFARSRTQQSEG